MAACILLANAMRLANSENSTDGCLRFTRVLYKFGLSIFAYILVLLAKTMLLCYC
jgi:hypothetical protein